jgi:hypothetical protein
VSRAGGGRGASLPPSGFRPQPRTAADSRTVYVVPEDPEEPRLVFDFASFPVSVTLQRAFAQAFAERTRPGAGLRAGTSIEGGFEVLRTFAQCLSQTANPPTLPRHLTSAHLDAWVLTRGGPVRASRALGRLKLALKKIDGLSADFLITLGERNPPRAKATTRSYSQEEMRQILAAARSDVRRAARRIRGNRALLRRWRTGEIDKAANPGVFRRGALLDHLDRHGDVPRYATGAHQAKGWVQTLGQVREHQWALHLSLKEAAAFAVLLIGMTGENASTVMRAPAAHFRADGHADGPAVAIVELDKRRRGPRRHMDTPLIDVPSWIPIPQDAGDPSPDRVSLDTPFAVYVLLVELAAAAREQLGSKRLLVWRSQGGGPSGSRRATGFREEVDESHIHTWAASHDLPATVGSAGEDGDGAGPRQLNVTMSLLRLSHGELRQKPVAHTEETLANEYLLRNRGNLAEYQRVVARVLDGEVAKARALGAIRVLNDEDLAAAREDPAAVAAKHGMNPDALEQLLTRQLDTVMAGCIDNEASPYAPAGQPCRASFMLCLDCPCARAAPHHLPLQALVHDALGERRQAMTPLRWAERLALPYTQLSDLLKRAGDTAVQDARQAATPEHHKIVERFLNRELDLR